MTTNLDDLERTLAFADIALGQIRSLRQPAIPRNYEIWYVYATGYNPALNQIINETLARNGRLSESDLDQIHDTYLSQARVTDRIDQVGARVIGEIDDVMTLISDALDMAVNFNASLSGAGRDLASARDPAAVKAVIEHLVKSTREVHDTNKALEERLLSSRSEVGSLQKSLEAIRAESLTDPLTALGNRKFFDRALQGAIEHAKAESEPLSLLMLDIDHFKAFNDTYGHLAGDDCLSAVGATLRNGALAHAGVTVGRYGGEEFLMLFEGTAAERAGEIVEALRARVGGLQILHAGNHPSRTVTASAGVAAFQRGRHRDLERLLKAADEALYEAKAAGRNRLGRAEG